MARHNSLLRTSLGGAAAEFGYTDVAHYAVRETHRHEGELRELHTVAPGTVELIDGSLALQTDDAGPTIHDQQGSAVAATAAPVPAALRFAAGSLRYLTVLAGVDALIGGAAAAVPASMSESVYAGQAVPLLWLMGLVFWPVAIWLSRGYRRTLIGVGPQEFRTVVVAGLVVLAGAALLTGFLTIPDEALTPDAVVAAPLFALLRAVAVGAPLAVCVSILARVFSRQLLHRIQRQGRSIRHVIVAGSAAAAQQLTERLQREPHGGVRVIGLCLPSEELPRPAIDGIPVLGNLDEVADVAKALGCDAVAVTSDDTTRHGYLRTLAWSLEGSEVELLLDPGLEEIVGRRLQIRPLTGSPLVHVKEPHFTGWPRKVKRISDVLLASLGLAIAGPMMLIIAAIVKLQDRGPVIFQQTRVGRGGQPFTLLKFRSMVTDAEARKVDLLALNEGHGALFKLRDDPRITRFGRFLRAFSLDELPQLINVLRGSMSLVGPRPHLAHELAQMPSAAHRRLLVTPGVTGLWQVSGRSDLHEDEGIRLDLRYVENWSLRYDLQILCKTASAVLARRGAR